MKIIKEHARCLIKEIDGERIQAKYHTDNGGYYFSIAGVSPDASVSVFVLKPNFDSIKCSVPHNKESDLIDLSNGIEIVINGTIELDYFLEHLKFFRKTIKKQLGLKSKNKNISNEAQRHD